MHLTNSTVFGLVLLDNPKTENFLSFWLSAFLKGKCPEKRQKNSEMREKTDNRADADQTTATAAIARQPNQFEFFFQPKDFG
ncbi:MULTISPECIES: hypothetical protein [unclassified Mesorhizobium]|uniref:hypothetical protein n=1 Tax=unclassified Mesorhizobium TaxID=325217 RepID=UPI000FD2E77F|nr:MULTISPECIES: hypothetical protein [unclassified Mesorhizobium]RVB76544.1 hypothetical protein EN885_15305 [Mesorhizobium sp. M6A.T.Cr.TU.014.01.1.1]RWP74454.1 MAG: hypothetical protein EOR09_15975 [Mesorhizobium sp.]RWP80563.1 MAG: hypothetical protein EOR10_09015 [Mesorhizobium sp.]RWQ02742.1 MAG: hypothetical protein EOR90_19015 [Mesorhizobium sp.]RWQ08400.1 MAG: hypothetical protein EOR91_10590 [Mesorhizobium sp.]